MDNLSFSEGLGATLAWMNRHDRMWPAVSFAVIGLAESESRQVTDTLAIHAQALMNPEEPWSKAKLTDPLAIEGVTEIGNFKQLLERWATGGRADLEGWSVPPPRMNNLSWEADAQASWDHYPLMRELPAAGSKYREARLTGFGEQLDVDRHNWLTGQAYEINPAHGSPQLFSRDYLGGATWAFGSYYLMFHLPLAVAMETHYDISTRELTVIVRIRPPLDFGEFELRVGDGLFDASLPQLHLQPGATAVDGWISASALEHREPGQSAKAWLTRRASGVPFGWEASADLGRPDTLSVRREKFLAQWYQLARRDFAADVEVRSPGMGKQDRSAAVFELGLANVLSGLGFSVFLGGSGIETPGVDLLGFDPDTGRAYAISATVSNDLDKKLTSWANVEPHIRAALEPIWNVRPVIITTQSADSLIEEHLRACYRRGVLVLAAEQIEPLKEAVPDPATFGEILAQEPPREDAFLARRLWRKHPLA